MHLFLSISQMWHFERVLVGPFKGAFMHPFFQRGNKALCAAMSRHHLPSAEMYQQALAASSISNDNSGDRQNVGRVNQYILSESPNQLVKDRFTNDTDHKALKLLEWHRCQEGMKAIETTEKSDSKPRALETPQNDTHDTLKRKCLENDSTTRAQQTSETEKKVNPALLSLDQGEDWSLLSDCLQRVLNKDMSPELAGCSSERQGTDLSPINNRFMPIDALAPGTETPASPGTIEQIFSEFASL
jgi:hypothetical protein